MFTFQSFHTRTRLQEVRVSFWALIISVGAVVGEGVARSEFVFSDFNGTLFSYTFAGFSQQTGAGSVRLFDDSDGWGARDYLLRLT